MVLRSKKTFLSVLIAVIVVMSLSTICLATGDGDVASAVESTWTTAREQVVQVVDNVVFPVIDTILAVMFFVKVGMCYFDYKKHGTFEFTGPAILFACLIFSLTAPLYIWNII